MLEILYLGSCDFKQESELVVVHTWIGDSKSKKKKKGICGICVSSRAADWYLVTWNGIIVDGVDSLQLRQVDMIPLEMEIAWSGFLLERLPYKLRLSFVWCLLSWWPSCILLNLCKDAAGYIHFLLASSMALAVTLWLWVRQGLH